MNKYPSDLSDKHVTTDACDAPCKKSGKNEFHPT